MADVAVLSLHTSPLAQPGSGDSGGMNVYVRELVGSLAQAAPTVLPAGRERVLLGHGYEPVALRNQLF